MLIFAGIGSIFIGFLLLLILGENHDEDKGMDAGNAIALVFTFLFFMSGWVELFIGCMQL